MKIKKFKNLWGMGLIIFGAILISLYLIKLIFPEFIINIAEIDSVVKFGTYVDNNLWAYYIVSFLISYFSGYLYCCACCRKKKLSLIDMTILLLEVLILFVVQRYLPQYYLVINMVCMIAMPTIMCLVNKCKDIKYLYSICTCFSIHTLAQVFSLLIRNIGAMITFPNTATTTILLIDVYIWQFMLYNFYNFKEANNNGIS